MRIYLYVLLLAMSSQSLAAENENESSEQNIFNYQVGFLAGCTKAGIARGDNTDAVIRSCSCLTITLNKHMAKQEWSDFIKRKSGKENQERISEIANTHREELYKCNIGNPNNAPN